MFTSTAEAGAASVAACAGKSAGDACIKPGCEPANPNPFKFCAKEAGMMTCRECQGVLYCKRPLPIGECKGNENPDK